jgi:glucokinase
MTKDPASDTFLALDIGGTNVTSGLVARDGAILAEEVFPTNLGPTPQALIDLIVDKLKILKGRAEGRQPRGLAVGAPGWLNLRDGVVVVAPNVPGWRDVPIVKFLTRALDLPTKLENDANLYALGEWLAGAGRGGENQITMTLGTGVGAGLILNGRLWSGSFTTAAEVGHIPLSLSSDVVCGCGRRGCLETVASARSMARLGRRRLELGQETLYDGPPEALTAELMQELAKKGDPLSLAVFREAGRAIGQVLAGVFNLLSLETAVIGGGASGAFEHLRESILDVLAAHLVTAQIEEIRVVRAQLGIRAPLVGGAALLAADGL